MFAATHCYDVIGRLLIADRIALPALWRKGIQRQFILLQHTIVLGDEPSVQSVWKICSVSSRKLLVYKTDVRPTTMLMTMMMMMI